MELLSGGELSRRGSLGSPVRRDNVFSFLHFDSPAKDKRAQILSNYSFRSQDFISNSPYCLPYNSYDVSSENLVLDQSVIS